MSARVESHVLEKQTRGTLIHSLVSFKDFGDQKASQLGGAIEVDPNKK